MVLHDTDFPDGLVLQCKQLTGEKSATKAVKISLNVLFAVREREQRLSVEVSDLRSKVLELQKVVEEFASFPGRAARALERVKAPDYFALQQEEFTRKRRK